MLKRYNFLFLAAIVTTFIVIFTPYPGMNPGYSDRIWVTAVIVAFILSSMLTLAAQLVNEDTKA